MRKIYISPSISTYKVELSTIIAASSFSSSGNGDQQITISEVEVDEFTSRRRRDEWADEEEEDF